MEVTDKSGKIKMTMELEINQAAMELLKENMSNMLDMASQMGWRPNQGRQGKHGEDHHAMGMMHHSQE